MKAKCKTCGFNDELTDGLCEYCAESKETLLLVDWDTVNLITGYVPSKQSTKYYKYDYVRE